MLIDKAIDRLYIILNLLTKYIKRYIFLYIAIAFWCKDGVEKE